MSNFTLLALSLAVVGLLPFGSAASTLALDLSDAKEDVYTASMTSTRSTFASTPSFEKATGHPNIDIVAAWSQPKGDYLQLGLKVLGDVETRNTATGDQSGMTGTKFLYAFALELDGDDGSDIHVEYTDGDARVSYKGPYKTAGPGTSDERVMGRAFGDTLLVDVPARLVERGPVFDFTVAAIEQNMDSTKTELSSTIFVDVVGDFPEYPQLHTSSADDASVFESPAPALAVVALGLLAVAAVARRR